MKQTIAVPGHDSIVINIGAFIDGTFRPPISERSIPSINPATGETLVQIADCGVEDVDLAVASARKAFGSGVWKDRAPNERKEVLQRFADLLDANLEELALLESLETGKPIKDTRSVDIPKSANMIRWYAEAIDKQYDEVAPTGSTTLSYITPEPLGVVGAVVPWNFPLYLAVYKLGPALATGNSIILKPAEQSSLSTLLAAELAIEAGLPKGVFNVVTGTGPETGKALGLHMDVDVIAFTGSPQTAKAFLIYAGQSNMKKVQLEAGGKSPNIIMGDTSDLDRAATQAAWGMFYNQGQVCSAGSRLLVERQIRDDFIARVVEIVKTMIVGNPLNPETQIGALIDENHLARILQYVTDGQKEGATLIYGGNRVLEETGGAFIDPTIFAGVRNDMRIAQEEIFGPVLSVIDFNGVEEAIQIANDSDYGLGAAIWSSNIDTALSAAKRLRAGQVWVNNFDASDLSVPWGGFKQSGTGRDKSLHAFDEYTGLKATWIELKAG